MPAPTLKQMLDQQQKINRKLEEEKAQEQRLVETVKKQNKRIKSAPNQQVTSGRGA